MHISLDSKSAVRKNHGGAISCEEYSFCKTSSDCFLGELDVAVVVGFAEMEILSRFGLKGIVFPSLSHRYACIWFTVLVDNVQLPTGYNRRLVGIQCSNNPEHENGYYHLRSIYIRHR